MNETANPKIRLEGVTKSFGDEHVLRGIDLEVGDGESVVLVGPSACGKTLLFKCILGLIPPDSGSIKIDGEETVGLAPDEREPLLRRVGMLFQQSALFDSLSIWENVAFRLIQSNRVPRTEARRLAVEKLSQVGMDPEVADLLPAELSGGMQKRVGFARAIAGDPEIVFLDEPTAGLDPIMSNIINELILDGVRRLGATTLSITSDMSGARKISDRIAMLHDGKIIWQGPTDQVDAADNPYLDQFIHSRAEGPIETVITPDPA